MLNIRGVTRRLSHETRRDMRLGSRERDEMRFLDFKKKKIILNDEIFFYSTEKHKMEKM